MFSEEEIEEIKRKYKLSSKEHDDLYEIIKRLWTADTFPVENPIAIIIGGQTGAGKSGIISYSKKMFSDGNVVTINSDEIKPFHPMSEEIARDYPELYTVITDQESNTWTSQLFQDVRDSGYNIIFEGTMKNNRIADDAIVDLLSKGYTVIVRGLAVCDLESRLSTIERYEAQVATKGWGRLVVPEHHNQTYQGMPNTIRYIEDNGRFDILEIFRRGDNPDSPELIYGRVNGDSIDKVKRSVSDKRFVSKSTQRFGYPSASQAVLQYRQEDYVRTFEACPDRFRKVKKYIDRRKKSSNRVSKEEEVATDRIFLDLMKYYESLKKDREVESGTQQGESDSEER